MAKYYPFGATTYNLGTSISSTDTTISLSSFLEPVTGTPYTMTLLNTDIAFATIAPKTTSSEFVSFTGITQNVDGTATLTGVVRGLAKKYPFTTDASYKLPHSGQSQFIISDAPQVFQEYISVVNDQSVDGIKTFTSFPVTPSSAPTADYQVANKKYVDDTAIAGAPNATTTVKGIVELATQAEVDAKTATGGTGASLVATPALARSTLLSDYVIDTGTADAYVITPSPAISAYVTGQTFSFKSIHTNTTTSTVNVNGLGAKTIKKVNGATNLVAGDIVSGQIITVEYDGTNFQMLNPVGNAPSVPTDIQTFLATGTWTKPAGAMKVLVQAWGGGGSGANSANNDGAGGGGGGLYIERWLDASALGSTIAVTIGAGGAAVSSDVTVGNAGGNTTFSTFLTAYGGAGGDLAGSNAQGGPGGLVYISINGLYGAGGTTSSVGQSGIYSAGGGGATGSGTAYAGGASYFGGGGGGGAASAGAAGGTSVYGGSGSAGTHNSSAATASQPGGGGGGNSGTGNSGAGGDGKMIVTTYF